MFIARNPLQYVAHALYSALHYRQSNSRLSDGLQWDVIVGTHDMKNDRQFIDFTRTLRQQLLKGVPLDDAVEYAFYHTPIENLPYKACSNCPITKVYVKDLIKNAQN